VNEFERVGERVAEGLGGVSDDRYDAVRVAFLKQAPALTRRHGKRRSLVIAVGLVFVGLAGVWGWQHWLRGERSMGRPNVEDLWLEGPKYGPPTRVELGPGAHIDLVAGTRARVYRNGGGRTRVTVEEGAIEVLVDTQDERNWSFLAGPYLAQASQGEFVLRYQPGSGKLEAGVTSGALHVSGGQLGADSVQLVHGQRLRAGAGSVVVGGLNDP